MAAVENPIIPSTCKQKEQIIENNHLIGEVDYSKYSFFPITNSILESFYQRQKAVFWTPQELDYNRDRTDWDTLDEGTESFLKFVLFLFAQLDGIVGENCSIFKQQTSFIKEATFFYAMQEAIETIHNETYSILIDTFIRNEEEKKRGYNAIKYYPSIGKIADWMFNWMDDKLPLTERVVAFTCVEGIFFSSAFAAIYWIKRRNILPALCKANEFIARDEALHTEFGVALYHELSKKKFARSSEETIHDIIKSAVIVSENFVREALHVDLIGMNADDMVDYVKCTADVLSMSLGYDSIYKVVNPFNWMAVISLPNKSNFFESKVSEYGKPGPEADFTFDLDADF